MNLVYHKTSNSNYFLWGGARLPTSFRVTVRWPNGVEEQVDGDIEYEYADHAGMEWEELYLSISHNGFAGLLYLGENDLDIVVDINPIINPIISPV